MAGSLSFPLLLILLLNEKTFIPEAVVRLKH
jgi:hypothetical protein